MTHELPDDIPVNTVESFSKLINYSCIVESAVL